jgi:hypothetical protein
VIGGFDLQLSGPTDVEDIDVLLHVVRARWRTAVVETGSGDRVMKIGQAMRTGWPIPGELFLYESDDAWRQWTELGLTEDHAARMISVSVEPDAIYFVVNAPTSASATLVANIIAALSHHRRVSFARSAA